MGKTDWKDEAKALKKKLSKLKARTKAEKPEARTAGAKLVSPLAPASFPTLPAIGGVEFSAVEAGVRYQNRKDVMLIRLAPGTSMAGVFTRSSTRAACVLDCQAKIGKVSEAGAAIIVNSGNSNAFTGAVGVEAVEAVTGGVAEALGLPVERVFSSSTGVIGEPLPYERITAQIPALVEGLSGDAIEMAARAMMTTDTFPKGACAVVEGEGGPIQIAGIAKGSGMIAPDMATMLVYIFTDAKISQPLLQKMLSRQVEATFNAITVDSDTSTSDALLLAATGTSPAAELNGRSKAGRDFEAALGRVMLDLAHQVVRDGEGATKFVEIRVTGAEGPEDAHRVAMAIANSPLVKTAIAGEDPNWGRIVMAVGKSGAVADRDRLSIRFGDILVAEKGWRSPDYREEDGAAYMKQSDLVIAVDLGLGTGSRTVWTCDLTHRYIDINADYRS
ncbi:bifunctional glutamate N-acetyltransferase/amino-acid acetyltransferase ArgJ [Cereibacter azotoformans]|uniref:Arginine biosynthesis bifunctional protein ArgJ n=1 Tax=Cereibacter azotoformans TaxID=43057 RepID=A0A2T5K8L6_9RHOB|nr:bifunctional glutamate N-acetyltransferase/amino-acid acetyltransferase ArgJ [Cereibacter azotoformans]AXQ94862.1 bifunctional glutamate N-acetyltransferase/amino-acid acetyltransferase ArgJ [Cereibacter sphaeroides]MBO4170272.1 bifunctional glutamate N-acetyltransferase/amino-acid acetyltransferase ArgJ [Cereibacter azotoformans]PTR18729.1 N-acetylglutamate synthase /glutamate N-acetyltransferase [Cereibacter azotoformans]UIJ30436.1 bifunctional glutamate N-acetyltransferase/amino-acid acet